MNLGDYIKWFRHSKHLSQRQFAEKCGVSNTYISFLEKGVNPTTGLPINPDIETVASMAEAMGMTLGDLHRELGDDAPESLKSISFMRDPYEPTEEDKEAALQQWLADKEKEINESLSAVMKAFYSEVHEASEDEIRAATAFLKTMKENRKHD